MSSTITGSATGVVSPNIAAPNLVTAPQATVASDGESPEMSVLIADFQIALNYIAMLQRRLRNQYYGDGSDGVCSFDGTSTVPGATLSGGVYTMTRNIYATVASITATVKVNGFELFAQQNITVPGGTISAVGASGSGATGGTSMAGPHSCPGVAGLLGSGVTLLTGNSVVALGSSGGHGGGSGPPPAVSTIAPVGYSYTRPPFVFGARASTYGVALDILRGGGGGGGGYGDGTNDGGGGGEGGGLIVLFAPTITFSLGAVLNTSGGAGAAGVAGNASGGGGGGGGAMLFVCETWSTSGPFPTTYTSNGGAGGAGSGSGSPGAAGTAGNTTPFVVTLPLAVGP